MQIPTALLKNIRPRQITVVNLVYYAKRNEEYYLSKQLYELCTSCTHFARKPCRFTNSLFLSKEAFCLRQFTEQIFAHFSTTWRCKPYFRNVICQGVHLI